MAPREAYVTGVGQSQVGVRLTRSPLLLTADAVKEALAEAGLTIQQIDGVATYPGRQPGGYSPVGCDDLIDALGIPAKWYLGAPEITSQLGAVVAAADAVKAGHARHIICFRTVYEAAAIARPEEYPPMNRSSGGVSGSSQWTAPFNATSAGNWIAQYAMRHVKKYGLTREQLAQVSINGCANAVLNPRALVKEPLTMDKYMSSRLITTPFCLYDCDRFTDGSTALIVSAGDAVNEVKCTPIRVAAASYAVERYSWDQPEWMAAYPTGAELWKHTDYKTKDVDVVQFYDGFSFCAITWLEALGFCKVGEGGQFIEGGKRIARDGELPMNTFGGQIGAGRLHGFGFAHEAVLQLRGAAGPRQVAGNPRVGIATSGGGPLATALLLARD